MKSFQIFNSVKDATILAADTSGLLKNAKVKVSFEFVQYLRNGVFVVVEDLPNWVQNTSTGKYTANYLYDDGQPVSLVFYEDAAASTGYSHFTVTRKMWHHKCVFDITEVVRQFQNIDENFFFPLIYEMMRRNNYGDKSVYFDDETLSEHRSFFHNLFVDRLYQARLNPFKFFTVELHPYNAYHTDLPTLSCQLDYNLYVSHGDNSKNELNKLSKGRLHLFPVHFPYFLSFFPNPQKLADAEAPLMSFSINQDGDEAIYNYRSVAWTDAENIYIASIYLNKYFDKRLARTAHRFDVNIPDVFAETKAQRALYDMYYLNATSSNANSDQRIKAVGLLEEHFIIDSRSKGIYLGFVDSRGLPSYILLDELEETQTLDYSKEYSTGESTNRESQALFYPVSVAGNTNEDIFKKNISFVDSATPQREITSRRVIKCILEDAPEGIYDDVRDLLTSEYVVRIDTSEDEEDQDTTETNTTRKQYMRDYNHIKFYPVSVDSDGVTINRQAHTFTAQFSISLSKEEIR